MFWGLIMEPNKRYTHTVEKSFHVSMASLDAVTAGNEITQVMLFYDDLNYLLCSLQKGVAWQVPLDLNFQEGTKIAFTCNGRGLVHLTGYLIPEENLDMDDLEEEEEEEGDNEVPQLVGNQPKRKAQESPKESKKLKRLKASLQQEESSSDDDDDDLENDDDQNESLEIDGEFEEDSDDAEDDDVEEEEEEDDSEEEETDVKPQQKKSKQQKEQQQANKKQEKQKLVNGKDAKQEKKKGKGEQVQQQQQQKKNKGEQQQQNNAQQVQKKRVVDGGVQIEDVKVGNGPNAKSGKFVSVYYVGRLTDGMTFDSRTQGEGFKFRLGKGEVIKGWDVGIAGMKVGGKRRLTIPPGMAYGAKGSKPVIPGNSTLVFEVELKNVH